MATYGLSVYRGGNQPLSSPVFRAFKSSRLTCPAFCLPILIAEDIQK